MAGINKRTLNIFILFLFIAMSVVLNTVYAENGNKIAESAGEKIIGPMLSGKYEKMLYQMYNIECQRNISLLNFALLKSITKNILYNTPLPKNVQDLDPNLFPNKKIPLCPYGRPYEIVFDSNGFPMIKPHIHTFEEFKKRIHISETEKYMKHLSLKEKLIYIRNVIKSMTCDSNVAVLKTAIINYYLENNKYPASLNDLCPRYIIGNMPSCPFGEKYKYNPNTGDIPWHNHLNR